MEVVRLMNKARAREAEEVAKQVSANIDNFRLDLAADQIYHFVWDRFAAEILEESKPVFKAGGEAAASRARALFISLTTSIKLLHPFMPFVTEAIWKELPSPSAQGSGGTKKESDLLMVAKWPV